MDDVMDISSVFLFSRDENVITLSSRITLSSKQLDDARILKNQLLNEIKSRLKSEIGIDVKHWLQGSYKNHTLVCPVRKNDDFDIDAGIYLLCNAPKIGLSAANVRKKLRDVLQSVVTNNHNLKLEDSKKNCERLSYAQQFHIDLPVYYFDETNQECKLATIDSGWTDSDPKVLQDYFNKLTSNLEPYELARLRRVIKYIKSWVLLKWKGAKRKIPSLAVTFYVAENYQVKDNDHDAFILMAASFAAYFLKNDKFICNKNGNDLLGYNTDDLQYAREMLSALKKDCDLMLNENNNYKKLVIWSNLFEYLFPPLLHRLNDQEIKIILPKHFPIPQLLVQLTHNKKQISIIKNYKVQAYKGDKLLLSVLNKDDYPMNTIILWRVRNQGIEASEAYDLGHEYLKKSGEITHDENCAYEGTHYVECMILD
ncbi:MAG: hypothetical protein PSV35_10855, partial [bacterium]|nr:hypothetical protein [bacterium]